MKKYLLFLLLLPLFGRAAAAPEARYDRLSESWTLRPDGTLEYRCAKQLTLFTHTAMNGTYGESFIVYDPACQELVIHDAYTRQKDGTIVRTPENAFVEVLPAAAADAPAYNGLKEMVVVHTGLELGATVFLDYSVVTRADARPQIDVCRPLLQTSPVREYRLSFSVPAGTPVRTELLALSAKPSVSRKEGMETTGYVFRNLPAASREPEVSPAAGDVPVLTAVTASSAQAALQPLVAAFAAPDATVTALAARLTEGCGDELSKMRALWSYVGSRIARCPLTLEAAGYRVRPAADVVATAYGTDAERANLLYALLTAAGLPAEPLAAYRVPADEPGLGAVSALLVETSADGRTFRLVPGRNGDAAAGYCRLRGLRDGKMREIEPQPRAFLYEAALKLSDDAADARLQITCDEAFLPYAGDTVSLLLPGASGSAGVAASGRVACTGSRTLPMKKVGDGYSLLTLPVPGCGYAQTAYADYNTVRNSNLLLPYLSDETTDYLVELPAGTVCCTPAGERKVSNAAGMFVASVVKSDGRVSVSRTLKLKKRLIAPADYAAFRALMVEWNDADGRTLLFRKEAE